jgi:hypothetical protein
MYADDAAVFVNPIKEEIQTVGGLGLIWKGVGVDHQSRKMCSVPN